MCITVSRSLSCSLSESNAYAHLPRCEALSTGFAVGLSEIATLFVRMGNNMHVHLFLFEQLQRSLTAQLRERIALFSIAYIRYVLSQRAYS